MGHGILQEWAKKRLVIFDITLEGWSYLIIQTFSKYIPLLSKCVYLFSKNISLAQFPHPPRLSFSENTPADRWYRPIMKRTIRSMVRKNKTKDPADNSKTTAFDLFVVFMQPRGKTER